MTLDKLSLSGVKVTVTDKVVQEKSKRRTVYQIEVVVGDRTAKVCRRYNECLSQLEKVKKLMPEASSSAHLKLPGKKLFKKSDPELLRSRCKALTEFVRTLVTHPSFREHPTIRAFFNLGSSRASSTTDDEAYETQSDRHGSTSSGESGCISLGATEKTTIKPDDFEFLKVIGKGSFGKVLLARYKTEDTLYAVKVLDKSQIIKKNEVQHIMAERNVLIHNVSHPFLVGLHYSFQTTNKLYFVLDYVNGGELFFHIQREKTFGESRARFYAAEIASALGYLHSLNIVYRDLKPENILLDAEGHVVLTDFGLCKEGISAKATTTTFCGTPEYLAPEILQKKPYDRTVDWWCLGAVLFEMIFGLPPFYSRNKTEMYENTLNQPLQFRSTAVASPEAKDILEKLLEKNKDNRLGVNNDIAEVKQHAFFASINWKQLEQRAIKPPFVPELTGKLDMKNFDQEFVSEPVPASIERMAKHSSAASARNVKSTVDTFHGFSYARPCHESIQF